MASNWIPFHADLLEGRHLGVSFGARFTLLAISMKAKRLDGIVELPFAKDDVDAVCKVTGGERRDVKACLDFYTRPAGSDKEPTLVIEERDGQRIIRIPGWQRRAGFGREAKGASTARVQAHRERVRNASETKETAETAEPTGHETAVSSLHGVTPETLGNASTGQDITGQDNGSPPLGAPREGARPTPAEPVPGDDPSPDSEAEHFSRLDRAVEDLLAEPAANEPDGPEPLRLVPPETAAPTSRKARRKPDAPPPTTPCPDDFTPTAACFDCGEKLGFPRDRVEFERAKFVDHCKANGRLMVDWPATFRTWLRNTLKFEKQDAQRANVRSLPGLSTLQQPSQSWTARED